MQSGINDYYKNFAEEKLPGLVSLLEECMNFERWGFKQSFYGPAEAFSPGVIYDSDKCRVRFAWIPADVRDGPDSATVHIVYGRLHASDQQRWMIWNGHKCHCWHRPGLILKFLDGLSPQEAVEQRRKLSPIREQFIQFHQGHSWSGVEWVLRQEAFIWEQYGDRLFDLFDIRRPDLWEQFSLFIREFYRLDPGFLNPAEPWPELIC